MYKIVWIMAMLWAGTLPGYAQEGALQYLSPEAFRAHLDTARDVVLVDVRTDEEVREGTIPGAIQVNVSSPDFKERVNRLDRNKTYMVYCKTGVRSKRAATTMKDMGFRKLFNLEGGIVAWKKKGFPVGVK